MPCPPTHYLGGKGGLGGSHTRTGPAPPPRGVCSPHTFVHNLLHLRFLYPWKHNKLTEGTKHTRVLAHKHLLY